MSETITVMSLLQWEKRVKTTYSLLFTAKKERSAAKPGPEEKKTTIQPAPEEPEVTSKRSPEVKGTDSEGILKTRLNTFQKKKNLLINS